MWLALMKEELGNEWLSPHLFRLGASSLLADIERQVGTFYTTALCSIMAFMYREANNKWPLQLRIDA